MEIKIHTQDKHLCFDLLDKNTAKAGDIIELGQGVTLTYEGSFIRKSFGFLEIITLTASIPVSIGTGILANWLWDKLKNRNVTKIEIDRTTVEFEEGEIKRLIHEKFSEKGKNDKH